MKTIRLLFLFSAFAMAFVISACQKEQAEKIVDKEIIYSEKDIQVRDKILKFKERIAYLQENPTAKDAGTMTIKDAIWNLEADLNFTYGKVEENYQKAIYDSTSFTIPINSAGTVNETDVSNVYSQIVDYLSNFYWQIPNENKAFIMSDLENKSIENNILTIKVNAATGLLREDNPPVFDDDDYWMWGNLLGQLVGDCNGYNNGILSDAAEQIEDVIHYWIYNAIWIPENEGYYFYTDQEQVVLKGNEYRRPDDPLDNWLDYLQFYNTEAVATIEQEQKCLEPLEMNTYYDGTWEVIGLTVPDTMNIISFDILGKDGYDGLNNYIIHHKTLIDYGKRHFVPTISQEYPYDLPEL